jgi:hypothetical protein
MAARGRKRKSGERYPSGGLKPSSRADGERPYTPEQVRHRALALGIDPQRLATARGGLDRAWMDAAAGTALGRLTWVHRADGSVARRMGAFGSGKPEPWITDEMLAAAEDYRVLWVRRHRLERLPRRHAQVQSFERHDHHHDDRDHDDPDYERKVAAARTRLQACDAALMQCPQGPVVRALVEAVVVENELPAALESELAAGRSGAAAVALRGGLAALYSVLRERRAAHAA